ncbi:malate synthase [Sporosarcina sp. BI001-red]|uniref:malate synthase n=1 Tax=Sporosarcina sp. BI001-red TaxID=2282866 RepID=UPI000E277F67|nr:malate synthase [Sporosarcina sp. BI001-red]REB06479.1 malate synthase [Sporosarcina sp. BI001-red]
MNLINEEVTHKVFGEGNIVEHEESSITIDFNKDIKKFVYPDAFEKFITLKDKRTAKSLKEIFLKRKEEEEVLEREREEEKEIQMLEQQRLEILKNHKIHESSQIAFWLDEEDQKDIFTDWQVSTGNVQSGKNKGQPNSVARLRPNSAGLLTWREPDQPETARKILGLYMINEMFTGTLGTDGMVPSHAEFKIELSEEEAEQMLFWKYYVNKNYPERTSWNSGKFRYFDNVWTAQILKDIIALKTDEAQIDQVKSFLEYFCKMNALDIDNIPEPQGTLG